MTPSMMEDEVVLYASRWKLIALAVGAAIFVVAGLWISGLIGSLSAPVWLRIVGGYVAILFFGFALVYYLYRIVVPRPALVINKEGIIDNASAIGAGRLRWDEIRDFGIIDFQAGTMARPQRMLGIIPRDERAILARVSPIKRFFFTINRRALGMPSLINIPQTALPMTAEELMAVIERYRPEENRGSCARRD